MYLQILQNICSRIALEKGLYAQIVSRGGSPITAQELANGSGADVLLIGKEGPSRSLIWRRGKHVTDKMKKVS